MKSALDLNLPNSSCGMWGRFFEATVLIMAGVFKAVETWSFNLILIRINMIIPLLAI